LKRSGATKTFGAGPHFPAGLKIGTGGHVPQDKRNDVLHLKILVPCVRAFLEQVLQQLERQEIPARNWLGLANQALKLTADHRAVRIGEKCQINWREILPLTAIAQSQQEKIQRFREQQLQQGYKKSKGHLHLKRPGVLTVRLSAGTRNRTD